MINYASEAIEHIGAVRQLHFKKTGEDGLDNVIVKGYHARLPKDLFKLATVLYSPSKKEPNNKTLWFPCRVSTNITGAGNDRLTTDITYILKHGSLQLNHRDGWVKIAYYAFPTDCNGYPLIPDTATYQEAVYWYIVQKLLYPQWLKGQVNDRMYIEAKDNWAFFRNSAYAESQMPDHDELISLGNQWNKMMPEINAHETQEGLSGQQEVIKNKNGNHYATWV